MSCAEQLRFSSASGDFLGRGRFGARICALGLVLCLLGCQSQVKQSPPAPLAAPSAAPTPRPARPTYYVTINQLSLRTCPGTDCQKISTLKLNAEVEKLGESQNWTQIRVKQDGSIGYVSSRYLSGQPVAVAQTTRKKTKRTKPRKAAQPTEPAGEEEEAGPLKQEPSLPLPRVM